jgi:hypothetical protein
MLDSRQSSLWRISDSQAIRLHEADKYCPELTSDGKNKQYFPW